jgi:hypothetical protein
LRFARLPEFPENVMKIRARRALAGNGRVKRRVNTITAPRLFRAPLPASVGLALILTGLPTFASERWATLEAIHCVENPRDVTRPGPCGELGAYQFREMTWRMHTEAPFVSALDRRASDAVAVKHYEFLKRELERAGVAATPYTIALAWNGGLAAAVRRRAPAAARDYAERVANLAGTFDHGAVASTR